MSLYGNELDNYLEETGFPDNYQCTIEVCFNIDDSIVSESCLLESDAVIRFHDKRNKDKYVDMYIRTFDKNARNTAKGETAAHMNKISFKVTAGSKESQGTDGIPIFINAKKGTAVFDRKTDDKEQREIKNSCKDILDIAIKNAKLIDDGWKVNMSDEMMAKTNKQKKPSKNSKRASSNQSQVPNKNDQNNQKNNVTFTDIANMIVANNPEYSPEIIRISDDANTEGKNANSKNSNGKQ